MKKGILLLSGLLVVAIAVFFLTSGLYAGSQVADVIKMESKGYSKHKQPIVTFEHKKHSEEYTKANPKLYSNGCGECHHDENGKPLTALKSGDNVQTCISCHKEPGEKPPKEKMDKKERIQKYHAEAMHENCVGCHRNFNKAKNLKAADKGAAPLKSRCNNCHKK